VMSTFFNVQTAADSSAKVTQLHTNYDRRTANPVADMPSWRRTENNARRTTSMPGIVQQRLICREYSVTHKFSWN